MSYRPSDALTTRLTKPSTTLGGLLLYVLAVPALLVVLTTPALALSAVFGAVSALVLARLR